MIYSPMANHDIFLTSSKSCLKVLQQLYRINNNNNDNKIMMMMMMMMMIILMIINSFNLRNLTHMQGPRSSFQSAGADSALLKYIWGKGGCGVVDFKNS